MSTPIFQVGTGSFAALAGDPVNITGFARDAVGAGVDISSGYTARVVVQSNPAKLSLTPAAVAMLSNGSFALTLSSAQTLTLPIGTRNLFVELSNDSFSTQALVFRGQITTQSADTVQ